ncbi:hypothetical protein ACFSPU_03825 [Haoranjiania flava]|uniref:Uncharacterized protein n=1 Tax=Haoranjiania flava TaxID=1856322 RepID=A0AAE3IQ92_9BACT|nr:hypothetical protein [Haoranjiania flava]MCU7695093.1 hypothetical protein [Haoranjiania flava]
MNRISFLSKLAIIFNALYAADFLLRTKIIANASGKAFISLSGGWIISPLLNLVLIFSLMMIKKENTPLPVPKWIWATCMFFLVFQVIAFLFM